MNNSIQCYHSSNRFYIVRKEFNDRMISFKDCTGKLRILNTQANRYRSNQAYKVN